KLINTLPAESKPFLVAVNMCIAQFQLTISNKMTKNQVNNYDHHSLIFYRNRNIVFIIYRPYTCHQVFSNHRKALNKNNSVSFFFALVSYLLLRFDKVNPFFLLFFCFYVYFVFFFLFFLMFYVLFFFLLLFLFFYFFYLF